MEALLDNIGIRTQKRLAIVRTINDLRRESVREEEILRMTIKLITDEPIMEQLWVMKRIYPLGNDND